MPRFKKMGSSFHYDEFHMKYPFTIVFRYAGTVWPLVLPYCLLNIALLTALTLLKKYSSVSLSILPQGHGLMSLLIAYLGVSKVNLAYARYMSAQIATGHAFMILRELHQLSLTLTEPYAGAAADAWRRDARRAIVHLIHETVATLRNERHAAALAHRCDARADAAGFEDPMVLVHALRSHLYHGSDGLVRSGEAPRLQLLERCKLMDLLHEFIVSYRDLLRLASTSLPFVLVQMGRTFIFIWTLTIPCVLVGEDFFEKYPSAFFFVVLLTYGFLGLEFVSRSLSNPFGGELDADFDLRGMGSAVVVGIEEDARLALAHRAAEDRGEARGAAAGSARSLGQFVEQRQDSMRHSTRRLALGGSQETTDDGDANGMPYRTMDERKSHSAFL